MFRVLSRSLQRRPGHAQTVSCHDSSVIFVAETFFYAISVPPFSRWLSVQLPLQKRAEAFCEHSPSSVGSFIYPELSRVTGTRVRAAILVTVVMFGSRGGPARNGERRRWREEVLKEAWERGAPSRSLPGTQKVCQTMAFGDLDGGLRPSFYNDLGSR